MEPSLFTAPTLKHTTQNPHEKNNTTTNNHKKVALQKKKPNITYFLSLDSMAAESDSCCTCCFSFITTMGLTALFLWLSLQVDQPKFYLEQIYVPALNKSLTPSQKSTLSFNFTIKLTNPNKDKGIKYDPVHVAFSLFTNSNTTRPLANATIDSFYQGHQKKAHKSSSASAFPGAGNLTAAVDGKVYFWVDFMTTVRYKILLWYTKRYRMWGGASVEFNDNGVKVFGDPVKLGDSPRRIESGAPVFRGRYRALLLALVVVLLIG